ncbi:MAG: hypothetical protein U5K76_01470 [Woeseiaceae bacterium]|nr:hypothetical protein [Woeseiaceae bacterium]
MATLHWLDYGAIAVYFAILDPDRHPRGAHGAGLRGIGIVSPPTAT